MVEKSVVWLTRIGAVSLAAGASIAAAQSLEAPEERLVRFFERVCVEDLPGFEDAPGKLERIGFDVLQTVPGVFEARHPDSAYTVYLTPARPEEPFSSCALSTPSASTGLAIDELLDLLDDTYGDGWTEEPDGFGGTRYRVAGDGGAYHFAVLREEGGVAMSVERLPAGAE